MGGWYS